MRPAPTPESESYPVTRMRNMSNARIAAKFLSPANSATWRSKAKKANWQRSDVLPPGPDLMLGIGTRGAFCEAQLSSDSPHIVEARDDGQRHSDVQRRGPNGDKIARRIKRADQHCRERDNLGQGVGLAVNTGTKIPHSNADIQDRGNDQNAKVAPKYQHCYPPADEAFVVQHQKHCAQQQLVRDRVEVLPEHGALMQQSCQQSVKAIGDSSEEEKH